MIYKQPSIYKIDGENGGMAIKESIIDMADDWEDVSDQFELTNSFTLKAIDQTNINVEDSGIIFSKKLSVIFFSKQVYLCSTSDIPKDNYWHGSLSLKANSRFYDLRDTGVSDVNKMSITNYVYPADINRGINLHIMNHLLSPNISSTDWLGVLAYTGPGTPNGISVKIMIQGSGVSPRAFALLGLCFFATERQ